MKPLCLIPARGGSKRIPGKNLREFLGVPILKRVIDTCLAADLFDRVVVSSEDRGILERAASWGAEPLYCSTEYAHRDDSMLEDVLDHALRECPHDGFPDITRVCMVLATAVLLSPEHLKLGWEWSKEMDYLPVVSYIAHGRDAGQFYWIEPEWYQMRRGEKRELLEMVHVAFPIPEDQIHDINTEEDWQIAEEKYRRMNGYS